MWFWRFWVLLDAVGCPVCPHTGWTGGFSLLKNGGKVRLELWVKLGDSPRYTQMVPKWHVAGQPAETEFFNTCGAARKNVSVFAGNGPNLTERLLDPG